MSFHHGRRVPSGVSYQRVVGGNGTARTTVVGAYTISFGDFEARGFHDTFILGEKIGRAGSARTFKATIKGAPDGATPFTVKRLRIWLLRERHMAALFEEVRILRQLQHPNILDVYHLYRNDPKYYYAVFEYVGGGELLDHVVRKQNYSEKEARDVCRVLISTIKFVHDEGIVHRDIQPCNVLLADAHDDSSIKLVDFDSACEVGNGVVTRNFRSPEFVPPEIFAGMRHGTSVDMWNIGLLVHILLCGFHPFYKKDTRRMIYNIANGNFEFRWDTTSENAQDFVQKLLTVNKDDRMSAAEAIEHPWLRAGNEYFAERSLSRQRTLIRLYQIKRKMRAAIYTFIAGRLLLDTALSGEFSDCYELGRRLGEGKFAEVFEASRRSDNGHLFPDSDILPWTYAVKRVDRKTITAGAERMVYAEVSILNDLRHPNVVKIFNFFESRRYFHIVLELMRGGELFDKIVQKPCYNEDDARKISRSILSTLEYIHQEGIVHRNLKPENLLLADDNDYSVKIAGFSFAFDVRKGMASDKVGNASYVAPEVLWGKTYGKPVDMWSTGVIIYTILCGNPPFSDRSQSRLYAKIRNDGVIFGQRYWRHVSAEAKDLIRKLLVKDPDNRPTATEALDHPWLQTSAHILSRNDLNASRENLRWFNATQKLQAAIRTVLAGRCLRRDCARTTAA